LKELTKHIPAAGEWGTIKTKYPKNSGFVADNELTGSSKNFESSTKGVLKKRFGGTFYNSTALTSSIKDQYEAVFNDGAHHTLAVESGILSYTPGDGIFTTVTSGYSTAGSFEFSTYNDRVYMGNGVDAPQVYDRTTSYGGVAYSAPRTKVMGAQAPSAAPTFAADTAGGNVPAGAHTYKVTYLYYGSQESNPGPASAVRTVAGPNFTVNLTALPVGGYGVTARKIYRDDNDGIYRLVGTVSNNTATTFSDTLSTGTTLITSINDTPPVFKYIVTHLDRNWLGGVSGSAFSVRYSDPGLPDIFPPDSEILCNPKDPITALVVFNDSVFVLNRNSFGKISGRTKDQFRYVAIPSPVGCVDSRSIQIRAVGGVPYLVWLSDKGVWASNGSSVEYISDDIEDLVNFNIQQAQVVKGQNVQSTQSQFQGGTASAAINLDTVEDSIGLRGYMKAGDSSTLTNNPTKTWDSESEWEGGSSLTNLATNSTSNQIRCVVRHNPLFSEGSNNNTVEISSTLRTPIASNNTGSSASSTQQTIFNQPFALYERFVFPRAGTVSNMTFSWTPINATGYAVEVRTDSGGQPGALQFTSALVHEPVGYNANALDSFSVVANTVYWIGVTKNGTGNFSQVSKSDGVFASTGSVLGQFGVGDYRLISGPTTGTITNIIQSYTFAQNAVATSGMWIGPAYDSLSATPITASITHTGTFPSGTSSTTTIDGSDVSDFSSGVVTQSVSNLNGTSAIALSNKRYWRISVSLSTTDDRVTAQIGLPSLRFATTSEWISEAIDHAAAPTTLDALSLVSTTPTGTSVTATIATSADNITYSSYTAIGSATPARYSKVKITVTSDAVNELTASVTSATLNWTITGNLVSSGIDTGTTPAGWDVFLSSFSTNGGTVLLEMRSAATLGGLTAATFYTVTNGNFPNPSVLPLKFVQWRATLTASAGQTPQVDDVTITWFISNLISNIRVASLFYNRSYYLAAAEFGNTSNNVVLVFDENNKWRVYRGLNINTMGFFFNNPYYGSATVGKLVKFLDGATDQGTNIEMVVETKAFVGPDSERNPFSTLVAKKLYVGVGNTGATWNFYYSVDNGTTFYPLQDVLTGNTSIVTPSVGISSEYRLSPVYNDGNSLTGSEIVWKAVSNDEFAAELHEMHPVMLVRAREFA